MKKLLTILLGIALVLPLYSQEAGFETHDDREEKNPEEETVPKPEKKKSDFARRRFEIGLDMGTGFDNGLIGLSDVFRKKIVLDMSEIAQDVPDDGASVNYSLSIDFFVNVMDIQIGKGLWNFGFIAGVDGSINFNISKSLLTLISEGNINHHNSSGKIGGSGGIFTEIGLTGSAKYQVSGRTLYAGVKPAIFTPMVYIPSSSGISYNLRTERADGTEGIFVDTSSALEIYTATAFNNIEAGRFIIGPSGFDLSLEGEYALFPFLDLGGFTRIPLAPATLSNQMKIRMAPISIELSGGRLISGEEPDISELDFGEPEFINNANKKIHRPLRFDIYARYKPFKSEFLVLKPNIGFSVNVNKGDEEFFFNAGLEAKLNLKNLFVFYLGSGYHESIWRQRIGLALNVRAFELDLETTFRNHTFKGCFLGRGFGFKMGMRFGW